MKDQPRRPTLLGLALLSAFCLRCEEPRPTTVRAILDDPMAYQGKRVILRGTVEWSRGRKTFALTDPTGRIAVTTKRRSFNNPVEGDTFSITGDVLVHRSSFLDHRSGEARVSIEEYLPWSYFFLRESHDVFEALLAHARNLKSGLERWFIVHRSSFIVLPWRTPPDTVVEPGPAPVPIPLDSEPRFEFSTSGGFAGHGMGGLTITSTGEVIGDAHLQSPHSWSIADSQVAVLTEFFDKLDFMHMHSSPALNPNCPDAYTYYITYRCRGLMNTVEAGDGGDHNHPFWLCLGVLESIILEHIEGRAESTGAQSGRSDSSASDRRRLPRPPERPREPVPSTRNRVTSITFDGRPVNPGDTIVVDGGRSYRISWQGVCGPGCKPTRFSIAVRRGYFGDFIALANSCPEHYYDYTFPVSPNLYWLTPRVDFSDQTYAWEGFFVSARRRP